MTGFFQVAIMDALFKKERIVINARLNNEDKQYYYLTIVPDLHPLNRHVETK